MEAKHNAEFTADAEAFWSNIDPEAQQAIPNSVWCGKCMGSTQMNLNDGRMKGDLLVLSGRCAKCDKKVARVVESSEP